MKIYNRLLLYHEKKKENDKKTFKNYIGLLYRLTLEEILNESAEENNI